MAQYLDSTGLSSLWEKIKTLVATETSSREVSEKKLMDTIATMQERIMAIEEKLSMTETIIVKDFVPNGASFGYTTEVNFSLQVLVAEIDLSDCNTENTNECILSIGANIDLWGTNTSGAGNVIHLYYTPSTGELVIWCFNDHTKTVNTTTTVIDTTSEEAKMTVELSFTGGMTINGTQFITPTNCANILAMTSIDIGSKEGETRSTATYDVIKLVSA